MKYIDLRSDTTTQPTQAMREAIYTAEVGDDVYVDDPTVVRLEALAADMLGKPAALLVSSGTMGNQLSIMTHTKRGEEVLTHYGSHIFQSEQSASALLSQVKINPLVVANDHLTVEAIAANVHSNNIHSSFTRVVEYENALSNGTVYSLEEMVALRQESHRHGAKVHVDGARIFNAAAALHEDVARLAQEADSLSFCLSKGLCAPFGSIIVGSKEFIEQARYNRKVLGGGLRQIGFMAAAGIVALQTMVNRLGEDHENALYLAAALEKINGFNVRRDQLQINLVFYDVTLQNFDSIVYAQYCFDHGIKIGSPYEGHGRLALHHGITKESIDYFVQTTLDYLSSY